MKRGIKIFCFIFVNLVFLSLLIGFVSGDFIRAKIPASIETSYGPGEVIKGWINISLQEENIGSLLTGFNSRVSLLEFLEDNELSAGSDFDCYPEDCNSDYSASGEALSKSFYLDEREEKIIGFKISGGEVGDEGVSNFLINITSDAGVSCLNPLKVDVLNDEDDDGENIEWTADGSVDSFCGLKDYGCYENGDKITQLIRTSYCEGVTLHEFPAVQIGADVVAVGGGEVDFVMRIEDVEGDYGGSCTATATNTGEISCVVNLSTDKERDYLVCIKTKDSKDDGKYEIRYEDNNPCGFSGEFPHDFPIFARTKNYNSVGNFELDEDLDSYIFDYLDRYDYDCTNDCIVPIRFRSGVGQTINVSDFKLTYTVQGIPKTVHELYDLEETSSKIDMGFKKLDLEKAGLKVPSIYGNKTLNLKLGGDLIITQPIQVLKIPVIGSLAPTNVPAAIPIKFYIFMNGSLNVTNYKWDFGDNSDVKESSTNSITHAYPNIETYQLTVTIETAQGESSKTFSVKVESPKDFLNVSLPSKEKKLKDIRKQIDDLPVLEWLKIEIEKRMDFDKLDLGLEDVGRAYRLASTSSDYIAVAKDLVALKIPNSLNLSDSGTSIFLMDSDKVNLEDLEELGVGSHDGSYSIDSYKNAISRWALSSIDSNVIAKTYSLYYDDEIVPLLTHIKIELESRDSGGDVFVVVADDSDNVKFKENYNEKVLNNGAAVGVVLDLTSKKELEFSLAGRFTILNAPVYLSPSFSKLDLGIGEIEACDFDEKCEDGENYKNCISDCKAWGRTIIWIIVLLFVAFVAYIGLQEWYKRYYENHLFKDKNELFNLINFMNNALNQGIEKGEIFRRLKRLGWDSEKVSYAHNKFKGKRTGMWEIPLFKWVEKKEVKEELAKRKNMMGYRKV